LITRGNIPFEADPLRYGGDVRETSDAYWIALAERFGLPYRVIESTSAEDRLAEARELSLDLFGRTSSIAFERQGSH